MGCSTDNVKIWRDSFEVAKRYLRDGNYLKAEELLLEAYELGKQLFGANDGNVGMVLLRLSEVSARLGKDQLSAEYKDEIKRIISFYGDPQAQ